ncbi:MAG: acyl-CoA dehydrogenase family protein [Polyangiaceae bacterium]
MAFYQDPPELGNQYTDDRVLRSYLARTFDPAGLRVVEPTLAHMGELAGGKLYRMQLEDRLNEPKLVQWDAWGKRVDRIEITPLWHEAKRIAAEEGVVATAYEKKSGPLSRVHQFALVYLFDASSDVYTCPLAMTDGAAKTLTVHADRALLERAVSRLTSRDPARAWTSGQWMTERTGGSDVGASETIARAEPDGSGLFRLHGTKWFTSATTSQMALTLGRPEGNPPGGRGLALFYVEVWDETGPKAGIHVNRLKDKLGTRKVPTAELTLDGALAQPVVGLEHGIRNIAPMLNVTRTWNAVCAAGGMRRGVALARDFARKRAQFGSLLRDKPLHADTLAGLAAETAGAFHLAFRAVELLGKEEAGELSEREGKLLRLVTPLAKLTTGKQAVAVLSEVLECFGGAGYVEDTGLPRLLRDAQVLPIWEGTTNVLSLDTLRAIAKDGSLDELVGEVRALVGAARDARLVAVGKQAVDALAHAQVWLTETYGADPLSVEAGARRFALTLGRSFELALLVRHAQWSLDHEHDGRAAAEAARFAAHGVDLVGRAPREESAALADDAPIPL